MKKLIAALLALSMIFVFSACGENGKDPQPESQIVKVTFDTVGGSLISPLEIKKGSTVIQPASPTKDGFVFEAWYYNGSAYDFSKAVNEDITLYATWKEAGGQQSGENNEGNNQQNGNGENNQQNENKPETPVVESLKWNHGNYWAFKGVVGDPSLTVVPESARASVKFKSSDETIAVVDEKGNVTGIKGGKVTITAYSGDVKAELPFIVKDEGTGIKLNKSVITLTYMSQNDYCDDLVATVEPEWAFNTDVQMFIDNSEVAYFDAEGTIHALSPGKATITAKDAYGHSATCQLYVNGATLSYTYNTNQYYKGSYEEYYIWLDAWENGTEKFTAVNKQCTMHGTATEYLQADGTQIKSIKVPTNDTMTTVYFTLDSGHYAGLQTPETTFYIFSE